MDRLSIIIPTLNEAAYLQRTLRCLQLLDPAAKEIIVVDGGSQDETVAIARSFNVMVIESSQRGRSIQMNTGAAAATGTWLCFLHGDTIVPHDLVTVIEKTLSDPSIACGGFISLMAGPHTTRWGISLHNYLKTYYAPLLFRPHLFFSKGLRLLFGDQVMFCRRQEFWACGGFSILPIMEEADLCLKLTHYGSIRQINRIVQSSDRRVAQWGALKATLIYLFIGCLWGIGVPAAFLKRFYEEVR